MSDVPERLRKASLDLLEGSALFCSVPYELLIEAADEIDRHVNTLDYVRKVLDAAVRQWKAKMEFDELTNTKDNG